MEFKLKEYHRSISNDDLLLDIKLVAEKIGKESITIAEYEKNGGKYNYSTITKRFGGWLNALQKCGLTPSVDQAKKIGISIDAMISDLQRVSEILGIFERLIQTGKSSYVFVRRRILF